MNQWPDSYNGSTTQFFGGRTLHREKVKRQLQEADLTITIHFPPPLRRFTAGVDIAEFAARNLAELFEALESKFPGIKRNLCSPEGAPLRFINFYVNDEDIRFLGGGKYTFRDGDEVLIIPAIAGGCAARPLYLG